MTVQEAYFKFKKEHSELVILSCYEYDSCFTFHAVPKEYVNSDQADMVFDSVVSVSKEDGEVSLFNPMDISQEEYNSGKKVSVDKIDAKFSKLLSMNVKQLLEGE